jgi:hypothetical protein
MGESGWWFRVAHELHLTRAEAQQMSYPEFLGWVKYFGLRPKTADERAKDIWAKISVWAGVHNASIGKKNG